MAIMGYNFAPAMFLLELNTQCSLAEHAFNRLKVTATGWLGNATPEEFTNANSPLEIVSWSTSFLSAVAVIGKILFPGKRKNPIPERCQCLRQLLEIDQLPALSNFAVRNSFEHVDERLDLHLRDFTQGSFNPISVTEKLPSDALVLKRFDPRRLAISFVNDEIELELCMTEINEIKSRIEHAFKKLQGPPVKLWEA